MCSSDLLVYVTYQRGHRALFVATRRVLSPLKVEGVSPSTSAQVQFQDRGKRPMHDEGPSGGRDTNFTFIDVDASSPSSKLKEIIQEQRVENETRKDKL